MINTLVIALAHETDSKLIRILQNSENYCQTKSQPQSQSIVTVLSFVIMFGSQTSTSRKQSKITSVSTLQRAARLSGWIMGQGQSFKRTKHSVAPPRIETQGLIKTTLIEKTLSQHEFRVAIDL